MVVRKLLQFSCNQKEKTDLITNEEKGVRKIIVKYKYNLSKEKDLKGKKLLWCDCSETNKKLSKNSKSCRDSGSSTEQQDFNNSSSNNWKSQAKYNQNSRLPEYTNIVAFAPIEQCSFSQNFPKSSDEELHSMSVKELIKIFEASCSGSEDIDALVPKPSLSSSLSKSQSCDCSYKVVSSPYSNKWSSIEVFKRHKKPSESRQLPHDIIIKYKYFLSTSKDADGNNIKWNPATKALKPNKLNTSEGIAESTVQKPEEAKKGKPQELEAASNLSNAPFNKVSCVLVTAAVVYLKKIRGKMEFSTC